ncbi:MAG: zf-HC2 domain-containing protein [Treponema sp.]|nr:zf-HC2 domain-containing protein [Treponema sp.]
MSTCPTRDLHSIYLDNEMPESYKTEYEAHIQSCEACQKQLAALKKLQSFFREDSESLNVEKSDLDKSFERLQIKMAYSKTVGKHADSSDDTKKKQNTLSYFIPAAAAAAAVFAVMIPFTILSNSGVKNQGAVVPMVATTLSSSEEYSLNGSSGKVISGNITQPVSSGPVHRNVRRASSVNVVGSVVSNGGNGTRVYGNNGRLIRDVDVFRPDFYNEEQSNSIRVVVPGLPEAPAAGHN